MILFICGFTTVKVTHLTWNCKFTCSECRNLCPNNVFLSLIYICRDFLILSCHHHYQRIINILSGFLTNKVLFGRLCKNLPSKHLSLPIYTRVEGFLTPCSIHMKMGKSYECHADSERARASHTFHLMQKKHIVDADHYKDLQNELKKI